MDSVWALAVSPAKPAENPDNEKRFLTAAWDRTLYIWDVATKKITWSYLSEVNLKKNVKHPGFIFSFLRMSLNQ